MSTQPRVVCVMLANGRQEMVNRAVRGFLNQTYENRHLLIFNSGSSIVWPTDPMISAVNYKCGESIGQLRNRANQQACNPGEGIADIGGIGAEVLCHFDSDDLSLPGRLNDQVAYLQASGAEAVGYSEMIFWKHPMVSERDRSGEHESFPPMPLPIPQPGEAWRYCSPNPKCLLGTSLCYWASAWKRVPFPHVNTAEDHLWTLKVKVAGASAGIHEPLMIAAIHAKNTASAIEPGKPEWTRAEYADSLCREKMQL